MTPTERESARLLRVLWVSHGYGYGGDLMYFGEIFRTFRELVPEMAVVVDRDTPYRNPYAIALVPLIKLFRKALRRRAPDGQVYDTEIAVPDPLMPFRLAAARADVLIAIEFTLPALMATLVATLSRRKRLVLLVESDPAARGGSAHPLVRRIKRWAVRRADAIQTNNVRGRRYLVEDLQADPARVTVAPYLTSCPPGEPGAPEPDGPLRILFANSINQRKGLRQFLDALALLSPETRAGIALTVVGDGPERAELEERAGRLDLQGRLHFAGRRAYAELGSFYGAADVLAIPSLADYRSLAGFEGLGYGLILLASRYDGATEETVVEGVNGYVIDPFDAEGIAARIAALVADRQLVARMRHEARMLYVRNFSLEAIAENVAQTCLRAVAR
ncbi:MAG: hypothetical protein RIS94_776 [Pseudomonadota bacterium]